MKACLGCNNRLELDYPSTPGIVLLAFNCIVRLFLFLVLARGLGYAMPSFGIGE